MLLRQTFSKAYVTAARAVKPIHSRHVPIQRGNGLLAEVALRAGVSIATASRVLNGSSHPVSEKTRALVESAADELGYSPSALARALVTKRSRIVGVIVNDVVDPYFAEIVRGVEDVTGQANYLTIICNADRRPSLERAYLNVLRNYDAEGVIFAGSGSTDDPENDDLAVGVEQMRKRGTKVIALAPRDFECETITIDNRAAGYDAVDYVLTLGHKQVALISGPRSLITSTQRLDGCLTALRDRALEPVAIHHGDFTFDSGRSAALRLLSQQTLPEVVVATNDEAAIGVLMTLRQADVPVPKKVSVMGIGDTRFARHLELSTVGVPTYNLGAAAARRIVGDCNVGELLAMLPHQLLARSTTRRAR